MANSRAKFTCTQQFRLLGVTLTVISVRVTSEIAHNNGCGHFPNRLDTPEFGCPDMTGTTGNCERSNHYFVAFIAFHRKQAVLVQRYSNKILPLKR
jgi:hypothetical protein